MIAALAMLLPLSANAAPPSNDAFGGAVVIPAAGGGESVDTTDASFETNEPNHFTGDGARRSVWYRWTAPISGPAVVATRNSSFDTVAAVYVGTSVDALTRIASGDDSNGVDEHVTLLVWNVQAGTTYRIAIDGYAPDDAGMTDVEIRGAQPFISETAPKSADWFVASPLLEALGGHESSDPGRTMQLQFEVCSLAVSGTSCVAGGGSLLASGTSPAGLAAGTWGSWQPPVLGAGTYFWRARGIDDQGTIGAWSVSSQFDLVPDKPISPLLSTPIDGGAGYKRPQLNAVVRHPRPSATSSISFEICSVSATPAQTCAAAGGVVLSSGSSAGGLVDDDTGTWRSTIAIGPGDVYWRARTTDEQPQTGTWSTARKLTILASPVNDDFIDAQMLAGAPTTATGSNVGASLEPGEPWNAGTLKSDRTTLWYTWTAPATNTVRIATCGSDYDGMLAVFTGASVTTLTELASNDDGCRTDDWTTGIGSVVQLRAVAGTTYRIRVGGNAGAVGNVDLTLDMLAPPANDDLANAEVLDTWNDTMTFDFVGATREPGERDSFSDDYWAITGATVWYQWTAPYDMTASISRAATTRILDMAVFTGATHAALVKVAGTLMYTWQSPLTWSATAGTTYRIGVQAAGGMVPQTLYSPRDTSISTVSNLRDGTAPGYDVDTQSSTTTLTSTWDALTDSPSGLDHYETCFSSAAGCSGTILQGWTGVGTTTSVTLTGQSLGLGSYWYACVRAVDRVGNQSTTCSDGVTVTATLLPQVPDTLMPNWWSHVSVQPLLSARYLHDDPARTGQVEFQICSSSDCSIVLDGGMSANGLLPGANGTWTPSPLAQPNTVYWRARAVDSLAITSSWSSSRGLYVDPAPPPNDDFAAATVVGITRGNFAGTNKYATREVGESAHAYAEGPNSVWYTWVAPADMTADLRVMSAASGIRVVVYTGAALGSLTEVAGVADGSSSGATWSAVAGTTYRIVVDRRESYHSTGAFTLRLNQGLMPSKPDPLDGPWPNNDIDAQTSTTDLHGTWAAVTSPAGPVTSYEVCAVDWVSSGDPTCLDPWMDVGNVTAATVAGAFNVGEDYFLCVRAIDAEGPGLIGCSTGVYVVASLPAEPPPPTIVSPSSNVHVTTMPTFVARANFNTPDTGRIEFQVWTPGEGCGSDFVESGFSSPGLSQGVVGSWTETIMPPDDEACWVARTIDSDGDVSAWSDSYRKVYFENGMHSLTVSVETAAAEIGTLTAGSTGTTQFSVKVNPGWGWADLTVSDDSDTIAATCICGDSIADVPISDDPAPWLLGDHPGTAGITVLDEKGDNDYRDQWRWGLAPSWGESLDDPTASNWIGVPGPTNPLYLGSVGAPNLWRLGYRTSQRPDQRGGTYTTNLTFTVTPSLTG